MLLVQGLSRQPLVSTGAGNTAPGDDDNHLDGKSGDDHDYGVGDDDDDDHRKDDDCHQAQGLWQPIRGEPCPKVASPSHSVGLLSYFPSQFLQNVSVGLPT